MKKYKLLAISIAFLLSFTSCFNDEDDALDAFQVTWKLDSWSLETPIDLNNDGISSLSFEPGCLNGSEIKFYDDSNGILNFSAFVSYNTSNENGNLFFMTACSTGSDIYSQPISYHQDSETITNLETDETYTYTIENNHLYMVVSNGFVATDINTSEITVSQNMTYVFVRQ